SHSLLSSISFIYPACAHYARSSCPSCRLYYFFLLTRRTPTSTLFPYTTLFRSEVFSLDLHEAYHGCHGLVAGTTGSGKSEFLQRSEEHTSELQSRFDLVCRLLLEKKNEKHRGWRLLSRTCITT